MCCYSLRNRKLVIAGKGNLCVCVMIVLTRRLSSGQRRNGFRIFMLPLKVEIYEGNYEYFQKQKTFYSSIILTLHLFLYFLLYISLYVAAVLLYFQNLCAGLDLCFYSLSLSLSIYIYIYKFTSHQSCLQEHIQWNYEAFETFVCSRHNVHNARKSGKLSCSVISMYVRASCTVCFPDQEKHNVYIYINNILYIVSTPTCFDASISSSGTPCR